MKEFIEFRPLEGLADKPANFLAELEAQLQEYGVDYAVELLRLSGICVDVYGTGKYSGLLKESFKLINSYDTKQNISLATLIHDIELFDLIFNSFRDLRASTGVTTLSLDRQVPAFLLAGELFLGSLIAYTHAKNIDEIKKIYPFIIGFGDEDDNLASPEKVFAMATGLFDMVIEQLGLILKYLHFTGASFVGLNLSISIDEIIASRNHIYLFDRYDVISKTYEYWRFWGGKITALDKSVINFSPSVENDFISQRVGTFRSRIRRNKWMHEYGLVKDKIPFDPNTKQLPKAGYRLPLEHLSAVFCCDYFGSDDLSEQILGISLAEWVRAYTILNQISTFFLEERKSIKPFTLQEWCIAKTENEWIDVFETNGIDKDKAQVIVKNLTFDKRARDLIDCPFIPMESFLVLLPTLGHNIAPAEAMLSNFMYKRLDIGFRGKGLENRILEMLSQKGIRAKNVISRVHNEEYECDAVFILEDNLFFVECKAFLQPNSPRTYYEFLDKIIDASVQLGRISFFYENNLNIIKEKFELPNNWSPIRIHKIIVSSALVGESILINDCYVVDESTIKRFFDREAPGSAIGHVAIAIPNEDYSGEITVEKLLHVISDPPPIKLVKVMMTKSNVKMELHNLVLSFDKVNGQESYYLSRKNLKKLAKSLGISANYLKKKIKGQ